MQPGEVPAGRMLLFWNIDDTDVDLHVREGPFSEVWYERMSSRSGGRLYWDNTEGLGPELYEHPRLSLAGFRVASAGESELRLVGRVTPAETAARTVTSRVDGYVERLAVDFTGRPVFRGEVLLDLYSPMLVAAQQELLLAVRLRGALGATPTPDAAQSADSLVAAARRRLQYWDISDDQIAEVERSGTIRRALTLRSPSDGVVLQKNVVQGQAVMAGGITPANGPGWADVRIVTVTNSFGFRACSARKSRRCVM
jgi:hypothetical protein